MAIAIAGEATAAMKPPERRLDLGLIIPALAKYGGAERYLIECMRYWQDRHDITIYSTTINRALLKEHGIGDGVRYAALTPYFEGEHAMVLNALLLPKIWQDEIGQHDLYHAHLWPTHLIDLHPMVWFPHEPLRISHDLRYEAGVDRIGKEVVRNAHLYPKFDYDRIGDTNAEAYLNAIDVVDKAARPDRIVANSRHTARYLEKVYGRRVEDVVYPGVWPDSLVELSIDSNLFVTVGQLWSHKRIGLLMEAIALTDETQLIVIGSGPELQHLEELAERMVLTDRVFFLSDLSNHELQLVLARANAFLFAPVNEPFGIVVLEAMAAGKPVIAVNQGGYVEVCSPDCAFLLPPYPSAFAEKISLLRNNPDVARRMGDAARTAARQYTWERTARELETMLVETWRAWLSPGATRAAALEGIDCPLVGVQYYTWYGDGFGAEHWNDNHKSGYVSDRPLIGNYASNKGQTIEFHLDLLEQMGVDFAIINLHVDAEGTNGLELISAKHLFEIARKRRSKLRFAFQIAPYTEDVGELEKTITLLRRIFAVQPNYLHLDGSPALFWFWSSASDGNKSFIDALRVATADLVNIALSLRLPHGPDEQRSTFGLFRGFAPFSPLELAREENWKAIWDKAYRRAESAGMNYRVATISPGYDDRALADEGRLGNRHRHVPRQDGETYRRVMSFVEDLKSEPHLVIVSTFNEYHENTHIEPSLRNGTRYVDMTREFVARIKAKRSGLAG